MRLSYLPSKNGFAIFAWRTINSVCKPPAVSVRLTITHSISALSPRLQYVPAGLCNQTWYCSALCQEAHLSGQLSQPKDKPAVSPSAVTALSRPRVPHSLTCAVLKRFSSIKCDPGMESVIRMCLDAMALQYLQNTDQPTQSITTALPAASSNQLASGYTYASPELPQQFTHLAGPQTPTTQPASQISFTHTPAHNAIQQQLQGISMQSSGLLSGDSSQPEESAGQSAPSSIAESCVSTPSAPKTHPESLESMQIRSAPVVSQGVPAAELPAAQLPCLTHAHLTQLQSHAADFTDKDRRDWLVSLRFLRAAMQHADWPGDIWSENVNPVNP